MAMHPVPYFSILFCLTLYGGEGEKKLFLIIVNVLGHPKGVGGLTSISSVGVVWMFSGMTHYTT